MASCPYGRKGSPLTRLMIATLLCWACLAGNALTANEEPGVLATQVLHSASAYAQGGSYPIAIELTIVHGLHINSDCPSEPDLFPSAIKVSHVPGLSVSAFQWPPAQPYKPTWAASPMLVLEGKVLLRATLTVANEAKLGQQQILTNLTFQACDDRSCLMPDEVATPIAVNVVPAGSSAQPLNPAVFKK